MFKIKSPQGAFDCISYIHLYKLPPILEDTRAIN